VTPRGTDWSLAALVAFMLATGVLSLFTGRETGAWVFAAHGIGGAALGFLVGWKLRRVWRRLIRPWRAGRAAIAGLLVTLLVAAALVSGFGWALGGNLSLAGYNLLNWHMVLGTTLAVLVLVHALARAKPIRRRDLAGRRQFIATAGLTLGGLAVWQLLRPVAGVLGWRGDERRFTGSYEAASFEGNAFPATSWVADAPRTLDADAHRLRVDGLVEEPLELSLAELPGADRPSELTALLDCTGGFYSTQRWRGVALGPLIDAARPAAGASHLRVVSHTGYRWSFPLGEARDLLLATHVGDEPLSHAHGAPLRLVAPGRRGFQWVKWVVRLEVADAPDAGALASTVWSSFTAEGRGTA
jgi:hypothetical protein